MKLSRAQALEATKQKNPQLEEARELELRVQLHTVGDDKDAAYTSDFLRWVQAQVSSEKYQEFVSVMRYPLPTVGVTENIFDDLSKLFEAENANYTGIRFTKASDVTGRKFEEDYGFKEMMKDRVFKQFVSSPNSFFVIEPMEGRVDPELYFVNLHRYINHKFSGNEKKLEWLAWAKDDAKNHLVVLDEVCFHLFDREKGSQEYTYKKKTHNFGEVPADLIYREFFTDEDQLKVKTPLSKKLEALDWLLFWKLAKKVLDKSAPFPIYAHYQFPCNFVDDVTNASCEDGKLRWIDTTGDEDVERVRQCPSCASKMGQRMIAGSRIEVPAPETKEDVDLLKPVHVIPAEKVSIEYVTKEEERLENAVFYAVVGKSLVPLEAFSASETQIDVATESKKNTFLKMSKILEKTHKKIVRCFAKHIYGSGFLGEEITYGSNWFLRTPDADAKLLESFRTSGVAQSMRIAQMKQVVKNIYSNDPDERAKHLFLIDNEPLVLSTVGEVGEMYTAKSVDKLTYAKKLYFNEITADTEAKFGHLGAFLNVSERGVSERTKKLKDFMNLSAGEYVSLISDPEPEVPGTGEKPNI